MKCLLFVLVACLLLGAPSVALNAATETDYVAMAGLYFEVEHGPNEKVENRFNPSFLLTNENIKFEVLGVDLDLLQEPSVSVLWFAETDGEVRINVTEEILERQYAIGNNATPIFGELNLSGIPWRTVSIQDQTQEDYAIRVASVAYTNREKTGIVVVEVNNPVSDDEEFIEVLNHIRLEERPPEKLKNGPSLQYFF
jgi:hypothetical protein